MYYGGNPATISSGFSKAIPGYGAYTAPYGKGFGKGFGKPIGKGFGKPLGKGFGFPATKSGGYSSKVPSTTVATGPSI
jgi:hypothetical protein